MKQVFLSTIIGLLSMYSVYVHAENSLPLVCAFEKKQPMTTLTGYIVQQNTKNNHSEKLVTWTRLLSYENGQEAGTSELSAEIRVFTERDLEQDEMVYAILKAAKVDPSIVKSAKSISISDGYPSVELINFFNINEEMVTGAIIVPAGGIQICYPVLMQ